jgi:hypothetical protein
MLRSPTFSCSVTTDVLAYGGDTHERLYHAESIPTAAGAAGHVVGFIELALKLVRHGKGVAPAASVGQANAHAGNPDTHRLTERNSGHAHSDSNVAPATTNTKDSADPHATLAALRERAQRLKGRATEHDGAEENRIPIAPRASAGTAASTTRRAFAGPGSDTHAGLVAMPHPDAGDDGAEPSGPYTRAHFVVDVGRISNLPPRPLGKRSLRVTGRFHPNSAPLETPVRWNDDCPVFDAELSVPVLLSPAFAAHLRTGKCVLEVHDVYSDGREVLLGLAKVPLAGLLSRAGTVPIGRPHPAHTPDTPPEIVHPVSGRTFGSLEVTVGLGTRRQYARYAVGTEFFLFCFVSFGFLVLFLPPRPHYFEFPPIFFFFFHNSFSDSPATRGRRWPSSGSCAAAGSAGSMPGCARGATAARRPSASGRTPRCTLGGPSATGPRRRRFRTSWAVHLRSGAATRAPLRAPV